MTTLLIGAPVYEREWMIEEHLEYADSAARSAGFEARYIFVGPENDPTREPIKRWMKDNHRLGMYVPFEQDDPARPHEWGEIRFSFMARVRNCLLQNVRNLGPDLFLSLDTDILLHREAISSAQEGIGQFDAVGMKLYMTSFGVECPSYANLIRGGISRPDFAGLANVQVIMAAKLMTPAAYNVDYCSHHHGEDIGWSLACEEQGVKLGFDGRYVSKHIMKPEQLFRFDERCGW